MFKIATFTIVSAIFATETLATKLALTSETDSESEQVIVGATTGLLGGGLVYPGVGAVYSGGLGLTYPGLVSPLVGSRVYI